MREFRLTFDEVKLAAREALQALAHAARLTGSANPVWQDALVKGFREAIEIQQAEKQRYDEWHSVWYNGSSTLRPPDEIA